jgi:hypothetical protein
VTPYERHAVKAAIDAAYATAEAALPRDEIAINRLDAWLCGWVACDCVARSDARALVLPEAKPATLATGCSTD